MLLLKTLVKWANQTATTTGIFFALKVAKPPKVSPNSMDVMKLAGGTCGGVLVKD